MTVSELKRLLLADPNLKKLLTTFESSTHFDIDIKSVCQEMENLQKVRIANRVDTSQDDMIKQVIDNSCRDQSFRSRLAEISFRAFRSQSILSKSVSKVKRRLILAYKDDMYKVLKTQADRQQLVDEVMASLLAYINDMQQVAELANILITDIDKNAWSLKLVVEAVSIHAHKEHIVGH